MLMLWRHSSSLVAVLIVAVLYLLSRPPRLDERQARALAERFSFVDHELPIVSTGPPKSIRAVHPSLEHLAGWISFVGAAASLGDLDGDGLPNDLVYVDPRYETITVCPVPKTGDRFPPFTLSPGNLPFERNSTAPMGTVLGDFNEDGSIDILAYFWGRSPILFLRRTPNRASLSETISANPEAAAFVPSDLLSPPQVWHTCCMTHADVDGDGHADLVVGNYNPDGARTLDAEDDQGTEIMMGSWGRAKNGGRNRILRWTGTHAGTPQFHEVRSAIPADIATGWTFAIGASDLDGDLLPELYFAQDFGADALLHNRSSAGEIRFQPLRGRRSILSPRSHCVGLDTFNGMGVDFSDLNRDGRMDLMVSNVTSNYGMHQSNLVFVNTGDTELMNEGTAPFRCESEQLGLARSGWMWDVKFADFDNDGVVEVLQAAGFIKGTVNRWPEIQELAMANEELAKYPLIYPRVDGTADIAGAEQNAFFVRHADRYYNVQENMPEQFSAPQLSRGIATSDVNGDGRMDFVLANNWHDSVYFQNTTENQNQFLGLHLRIPLDDGESLTTSTVVAGHPRANIRSKPAIGAQARLDVRDSQGSRVLVDQVDSSNGHSGHRAPTMHFGLGSSDPDRSIRILLRWRDRDGNQQRCELKGLTGDWYTVYLASRPGTQSTTIVYGANATDDD